MRLSGNISLELKTNKIFKGYANTPEESLSVMLLTSKKSRVQNPLFGSNFLELVDKEINDIWILKAKKAILDASINSQTQELWDDRINIKKILIDVINEKVIIKVECE